MGVEIDYLSVAHLSRGCIVRLITFSANSLKPSRTTPKAQEQESRRFSMVKIGFRKDQRHRLITDRISTTDFLLQQSDFIARREEGTGQWFLESSIFTTWLQKPKSSLFCPGIPGAGKTILAAIMIDRLLKKGLNDQCWTCLYILRLQNPNRRKHV